MACAMEVGFGWVGIDESVASTFVWTFGLHKISGSLGSVKLRHWPITYRGQGREGNKGERR